MYFHHILFPFPRFSTSRPSLYLLSFQTPCSLLLYLRNKAQNKQLKNLIRQQNKKDTKPKNGTMFVLANYYCT